MKKIIENKYFKLGFTIFCIIAACILFFFLIFKINIVVDSIANTVKLFSPFIVGFVFAYLLNPIVKFFERKLLTPLFKNSKLKNELQHKLIKNLSIGITCVIVIVSMIIFFNFIIPELLNSLEVLITNIPLYLEQIKNYLLDGLKNHQDLESMVLDNYEDINLYFTEAINQRFLPQLEQWVVMFSNGIFGAVKVLYNVFLGFIISIYFLSGKDTFKAQIKKILYSILPIKKVNNIIDNVRHTDQIFGGFVIGKLLDCLTVGLITFVFLAILGYPYALLIGVMVGVTNVIPYFGPFIGGIPSVLLILLQAPEKFWILIIFLIALQQIDSYFIDPKFSGKKTGIKSFWVLFAILVFGSAFGVIGMIIGVPIFALIYGYINNKVNISLVKKDLPIETNKYKNLNRINSENNKIVNNK